MKRRCRARTLSAFLAMTALAAYPAAAADKLDADLDGFGEVPTLSSPATAEFDAKIDRDEKNIDYTLTYSGFPTPVQQAHLHLGRRAVNGGIMVFICSNLGNGPAGTPLCPASPATVSGTWNAASVVGPAVQGIAAGELNEVIQAIRAGAAYANIHTTAFPGGEIRDQVRSSRSRGREHDH